MDSLFCFSSVCSQLAGGESSWDIGKGRSKHEATKYGFSLVKGKANHPMEDYHVAKFVQIERNELGLFAVYDGHLGESVAEYLQNHLFPNILKEVSSIKQSMKAGFTGKYINLVIVNIPLAMQEDFWTDPRRSILKAYEKTDQDILSHSPDIGSGGSTAVTAILINGQKLWVANVGDSRAVLSRKGVAMQMSVDHEPNAERESIEDRGGFVTNIPGDVARVNGQLAVSRAFGDKNLKSFLRSDPDVTTADIDDDTDLLIIASDGLWKVMSNQEAVDITKKAKNPQKAAKKLAMEALNRESKDDISCIVVRFKE